MVACFNEPATPVAAVIDLRGNTQASLKWTFLPAASNPREVTISEGGTMDFRRVTGPVYLTLTLRDADPSRVFFSSGDVSVFGYSINGSYDDIRPVGPSSPYVQVQSISDDGRTVSICYRNRSEGRTRAIAEQLSNVRYTIYLGRRGAGTYLPYWIDPIISNGGRPLRYL